MWTFVFIPLVYILGLEMLDSVAKLSITFKEITILSFKVTVFTYPPVMYKGKSTSFSSSPPIFVIVCYSHSSGCEIVSEYSIHWHFPNE